jgi:transglutaminase-like putative cysteine protease
LSGKAVAPPVEAAPPEATEAATQAATRPAAMAPATQMAAALPLAALPNAGAQRTQVLPGVAGDPARLRVDVDLDRRGGSPEPPPGPACSEASVMINHQDPKIRELLAKALGNAPNGHALSTKEKAEALRRFVHHFIDAKDLSVGMATASEVARTAEGDCTEHAVLLAALLRAAGIPSRTVTGLLYVDEFLGHKQVFGYHMWAQAWLGEVDGGVAGKTGGRWLDVDAVLGDDAGFDAGHIALATSAMSDGDTTNDLLKMVPLFGRLRVRVVEPASVPETGPEK